MLELVADVGGTNARFALTETRAKHPEIVHEQTLATADYASLAQAIQHYLSQFPRRPKRAALAVASPISGDDVRFTNRAWSFNRLELQQALALEQLLVLNDFGAVAHAVPYLPESDRIALYGNTGPLRGPITVMGPGTGLGVAMLIGGELAPWQVVETEGGHVSFAPLSEEEIAIARWLSARFGRVSNERVLCGSGISHIDAVLAGVDFSGKSEPVLRDPAHIVAAALEGNDITARRTLARFCAVLGSVAGDLALAHGARTVMIAGGIVPRFVSFLRTSAFRERFLAKGRFAAYLEDVAIQLISHANPGLLGAAVALRKHPIA